MEVAQYYSQKARKYGSDIRACEYKGMGSFEARQKILLEILGSFSGKSVLDIGCGTGLLSAPLAKNNKIVGVDISAGMLELARVHHAPVSARGEALPFKKESFDAVLAVEVLQHAADPGRFLAEMARVSKPRGRIILMMIHSRSWLQRLLRAIGLSPGMYHWHSPDQMASFLSGHGWKVSEFRFLMLPFHFVLRSSGPRHPLDFLAAAWTADFHKEA